MTDERLPGLYVHVPFCRSKCFYCDFYSITAASLIPAWLSAVLTEARLYKERFGIFDSLYIGGGTPTVLDTAQLELLINGLLSEFHFLPDTEVTIEANPDCITREKLDLLRELGVNRISLGVQSFDDDHLSFLGRQHTASEAELALENIRTAGITNLGVDLIYGSKDLSEEKWVKTLEKALTFKPEHLSCYQLTLEKGARFGKMKDEGLIKPISEEDARRFFIVTSLFLRENGYVHYEISNFALNESYYSRHNQKYWRHVPYLGLGPSAHSFKAGVRWWNDRSVKSYCTRLDRGELPIEGEERLSEEQLSLEAVYLGLRTKEGLDIADIDDHPRLGPIINQLLGTGLIEMVDGRITPTVEGTAE
ncbi:MAG: radical SAM family heme chaperone HemW [Deltaproteobacteria bacterium]|nr:radical SAM family heme chaperone HemW [Deltaproteobacteria bacterium]